MSFVARLGKQLLEKQILKIVINLLWQNGINSCQYNTAWAILLFVSRTRFCCLLVPLNITPHHARVSCLIIGLTINATVKWRRWRWLIYAPGNFLVCRNMLRVFRSNHHCSLKFHKFHRKTLGVDSLFSLKWWNCIKTFVQHE